MDLILLKIENMMDINVGLFQWSISFFDKNLPVEELQIKLYLIKISRRTAQTNN